MDKAMNKDFVQRHRPRLETLLAYYKAQLDDFILPFWEARAVDPVHGGYYNCYDAAGNLFDERKPGWFIGRTMYTFSYLYNTYRRKPEWLSVAKAGRIFLDKAALPDGRFCQMLARDGAPLAGATSIFTDHFAVKGLYEYVAATAAASADTVQRAVCASEETAYAKQLTERLFAHVQDPAVLAAEGIRPGTQKHAICFMTLLVALESRHLFGATYRPILEECIRKSLYEFASDAHEAPFEVVGTDGVPTLTDEGRLIDPGHTMEAMWFCMRAGMEDGHDRYAKRAKTVLDWVLRRAWDDTYGGFYQHVDVDDTVPRPPFLTNDYAGTPVAWDDKIWWVQAEGLYALLMSSLLNGDDTHFSYFERLHTFVRDHFMDEAVGEWNSVCKRDGTVSDGRKGFALKGPYHVVRAHVQMIQLLEQALSQ